MESTPNKGLRRTEREKPESTYPRPLTGYPGTSGYTRQQTTIPGYDEHNYPLNPKATEGGLQLTTTNYEHILKSLK